MSTISAASPNAATTGDAQVVSLQSNSAYLMLRLHFSGSPLRVLSSLTYTLHSVRSGFD